MFDSKYKMVTAVLAAILMVGAGPCVMAAAVKDKADDKGKTDPAGVPLELKLTAGKDTYALDFGGKTLEQFMRQVPELTPRGGQLRVVKKIEGEPAPPPKVALTLELKNVGKQALKVKLQRSGHPMLKLEGPGAVDGSVMSPSVTNAILPEWGKEILLQPGKSHTAKLDKLAVGHSGPNGTLYLYYWTKPGQYTLTASYFLAVSPAPKGAKPANESFPAFQKTIAGYGTVEVASNVIKLKVVEPAKK